MSHAPPYLEIIKPRRFTDAVTGLPRWIGAVTVTEVEHCAACDGAAS